MGFYDENVSHVTLDETLHKLRQKRLNPFLIKSKQFNPIRFIGMFHRLIYNFSNSR